MENTETMLLNLLRKKMRTRIDKFGFEIEGEYHPEVARYLEEFGEVKTDGSLNPCNKTQCLNLECKEFASNPYRRTQKQKAKKVFDYLHEQYKQKKFHWNKSAGFHVHVSFRPRLAFEIFSEDFVNFFHAELRKKFNNILQRRGNNTYCQAVNQTNSDIVKSMQRDGDRYRSVNLFPSFVRHKTIEIRIFPASSPLTMYKYLLFVLRTIRKFLKENSEFVKPLDIEINERTPLSLKLDLETESKSEIEYKL